MAVTTMSDFKIYDAEFQTGVWEGMTQVVDVFNGASRGTIRLIQKALVGEYGKEAFFKRVSDAFTRRDPNADTALDSKEITQGELVSVKVNRTFGPFEVTVDSFKKIGEDPSTFSFRMGVIFGEEKAKEMLNTGMIALNAALSGVAALNYDGSGQSDPLLQAAYLVYGLQKFGDAAPRILAWAGHSKPYYDLVLNQIAGNITNIADRVIDGGSPASLNRPFIMSDIPALWDANASAADTYNILGLVADALVLTESESPDVIETQIKLGDSNIKMIMQGETAFNIGVKGFAYDSAGGGANPTNATLANSSYWDSQMASVKDLAGVRIKTQ